MTDLITKEKLEIYARELCSECPDAPMEECLCGCIKKAIYNALAEALQERHGQWIEPTRLYYGAKQYECSLCYSDTFWNKHCITVKYPHCPNCGADMREVDHEAD